MNKPVEDDMLDDVVESRNTFLSPDLLPNTAFIITKPKPIKQSFVKKCDKFMDFHNIEGSVFMREFLMISEKWDTWSKSKSSPLVSTLQRATDNMFFYDKLTNQNKRDRLYRNNNPKLIKENLLKRIDLFRARHHIGESTFSRLFFGNGSIVYYFRCGDTSISCSVLDRVFNQMHLIDKELIEDMGEEYERWKRSRGK